jgi:hypothetical protein
LKIFKAIGVASRVTTALDAITSTLIEFINERDPISTGDQPPKGVLALSKAYGVLSGQ